MIHIERPLRCSNWCCFCCLQKIEVQSPPGNVVGYVEQDCTLIYPWFTIKDASGDTVLKIKGPCWTCKFCDVEFHVTLEFSSYMYFSVMLACDFLRCCLQMVLSLWVRYPSNGLALQRSSLLMLTILGFSVSA